MSVYKNGIGENRGPIVGASDRTWNIAIGGLVVGALLIGFVKEREKESRKYPYGQRRELW